jgi:hypothetical protein
MKGYSQMTPAERSPHIAEQLAELDQERVRLRTEMAARFRTEGVPEHELLRRSKHTIPLMTGPPGGQTNDEAFREAAVKVLRENRMPEDRPQIELERFLKLRETKVIIPVPNKKGLAYSVSL